VQSLNGPVDYGPHSAGIVAAPLLWEGNHVTAIYFREMQDNGRSFAHHAPRVAFVRVAALQLEFLITRPRKPSNLDIFGFGPIATEVVWP
jgi:hypothetical protein